MTTTAHPPIWTNQEPHRIALDALRQFQWSVFPLDEEKRPPRTGKNHPDGQPKRLGWKRLQTLQASPEEISYWQKVYNPAAWAVITGTISGIVLLDFDGKAGQETRERLGLMHPHVQTGSGGHHVYFRHPGWMVPTLNGKSSHELGKRWPGLDIRADGGYAAFCGQNRSGPYRWLRAPELEELDILPDLLRQFLGLLVSPESAIDRTHTAGDGNAAHTVSVSTLFIRAHRLIMKEGKGRNDTGFWLACQLRDNGYTLDAAKDVMGEYVRFVPQENTKGQSEPYTLEEALASAISAFQEPARDPWTVTSSTPDVGVSMPGDAPPPGVSVQRGVSVVVAAREQRPVDACLSLPEIFVHNDQLRNMVDESIAAILLAEQATQSLFMQYGRLVRVGRNELGRPLLLQMGTAEVREMLTHVANFYRLKKVRGQSEEFEKIPVSPPKELAEQILARQTQEPYLPFPTLSALIEAPVIRPDGSILDQPGYDPATQLYYTPLVGMEACKVSLKPTPQERENALALLLSAIGEFPYTDEADKANALALLLTPILRPAIKRHVPLALIDAPKQGTGKGLLSDVVSIIATGSSAAILTLSNSEEELQKLITSLLIEGSTIITLDNVMGCLQSRHLDAALTSDMWHGRILGMSKMTSIPQRATWIATGNNIRLGGDLARRCYRIRLDAKVSRPFMRKGFTHSDLVEWVSEHRAELVSALLTLARAWYAAGKPRYPHLPSLGTFSGWVKTVGGILEYAGVHAFLSNLEQLYDDIDDDSTQWEAFLRTWVQLFGKEWVSLALVGREITKANAAGSWEENTANILSETLPEALQIALKEKPQSFSIRLGKALDKRIDTCFGVENIHLEKSRNAHSNTSLWRVFGGSGGSDSIPTRYEKCEEKEGGNLWEEWIK
jgi:Bifunctional DNA primase/polymerase, N-terminal